MGYLSAVAGVLALVVLASASIGDNSLDSGEGVVQVSPVLVPPQDSESYYTRARHFPILVLLLQGNPEYRDPQTKSLEGKPFPISAKKLEDQEQPSSARALNRQRRHSKKIFGGFGHGGGHQGGGGCYTCGGGHYGGGGGGGPTIAIATANAQSGFGKK